MKKFLLLSLSLVVCLSINIKAQTTIFSSDFESWNVNNPVNWGGSTTSIDTTTKVVKSTDFYGGQYSLQLINDTTTHKRFSTTGVSVTANQAYAVSFWAKGQGNIRVGFNSGGTNYPYSSYSNHNSATWTKYTHTIIADATTAAGQFILSVQSTVASAGHLKIDDLTIRDTTVATVSIYDIQYTTDPAGNSPKMNQTVTFSGTCTAVYTGKGYYMKDGPGPWRGVYVYTNNTNTPQVGDSVQVTGTVVEYYGLTEISNSTYTLKTVGNTPVPTLVTCSQVNTEDYEGVFVKVENVKVTVMPDSYGTWTIQDGTGSTFVDDAIYPDAEVGIVLNMYRNITGVVDFSFSNRKILPRSAGDVTFSSGINETPSNKVSRVYPNPAKDVLNIDNNFNVKNIEVYNVIGSKVIDNTISNNGNVTLDINKLETGIYILKINYKSNISETIKFIKE